MKAKSDNERYIDLQRSVTKAVLKFCEDHNYAEVGLTEVRNCLKSLNRRDVKSAIAAYQKLPLGGRMGYFDDWFPPVIFQNETAEYLQVVFIALLNEWDRVMKLSIANGSR